MYRELHPFRHALSNDMKNMAILVYRFLDYLYCSLKRNCVYRQKVNSVNVKYQNVSCLLFSRNWWLVNERANELLTEQRKEIYIKFAGGTKKKGLKTFSQVGFDWRKVSRFLYKWIPLSHCIWYSSEGILPGAAKDIHLTSSRFCSWQEILQTTSSPFC